LCEKATHDRIGGSIEQLLLARDVPIDAADAAPQTQRERAEGECLLARLVEERDRCLRIASISGRTVDVPADAQGPTGSGDILGERVAYSSHHGLRKYRTWFYILERSIMERCSKGAAP
jgi:hypothetical protein